MLPAVDHGDDKSQTWEQSSLTEPEKQAQRNSLSVVVNKPHSESRRAPRNHCYSHDSIRAELFDRHGPRDFKDDVGDEEYHGNVVELGALQTETLLEAEDSGIS